MSEWNVTYSIQFMCAMKRMSKRYPREVKQMVANLEKHKTELARHDNPLRMVEYTFVHREASGCHAITQQPLSSAAQTRLYVYCYVIEHELHLICMGDKASQEKDNRYCANYVKKLKQ